MVLINFSDFRRFAKFFEKYDLQSSVTQLAGLLTVPSLQANALRIETAIHLAVANCERVSKSQVSRDRPLAKPISRQQDRNIRRPCGGCIYC